MCCLMICLKFFICLFSKLIAPINCWPFNCSLYYLLSFIFPPLCVKWFNEGITQVTSSFCKAIFVEFLWFALMKVVFRLLSERLFFLVWNLSLKLSTIKSFLYFYCTKFSIRHSISFFIMLFWVLRLASTLKYFLFFCNFFFNIFGNPNPRLIV